MSDRGADSPHSREPPELKRPHRTWIVTAGAALIALVVIAMYPHTNPSMIHLKTKILGPQVTYCLLYTSPSPRDS